MLPTDLQRQTLRLYGELVCRRPNYGGQLALTTGTGCSATGLPAAVSLTGGTTLALDPDTDAVKSTFRQGGIDFLVNTLDEALRILKNEVRQRRPVSVALLAPVAPTLTEMLDRGVLPDLHVILDPSDFPFRTLSLPKGEEPAFSAASCLRLGSTPSPELATWLAVHDLTEITLTSTPATSLRTLDARLLALLPPRDTVRRTWLERISHYQRPTPGSTRVLWLTPSEKNVLPPL